MVFLPMIDLSPSDPSCIFSTVLYVSDQALQHKKTAAILTFDQPLYWKAKETGKQRFEEDGIALGRLSHVFAFFWEALDISCLGLVFKRLLN